MPSPRGELLRHFGDNENNGRPNARFIPASSSSGIVKILTDHVMRPYEDSANTQEPWQELPEIPTSGEIMSDPELSHEYIGEDNASVAQNISSPKLPSNNIEGPWESKAKYIAAHYQLLREDGIAPLRAAVETFRCNPGMTDSKDICVYSQVFIVGFTLANQGVAPRIEFSHERCGKRIRWKQSKRLQQGTIVALSPRHNMFKSICKVAVVAARPLQGLEQNPPQVDLYWGDENEAEFDPMEEYFMIESRAGYFEAYRHMLVALQKLMSESFSLSPHLASLQKHIGTPRYLERQPLTNLNSLIPQSKEIGEDVEKCRHLNDALINVNILEDWPTIPGIKLDESQMKALKRILAKKLAIVQGPPGSGKTFVSISALKVILDNWSPGDPPIIVSAQTNHALDQLLTILTTSDPALQTAFIRLGGRASENNKLILERTLYEVKQKERDRNGGRDVGGSNYRNCRGALNAAGEDVMAVVQMAMSQSADESQMLLQDNLITQKQFESLENDDWIRADEVSLPSGVMASWLGSEQLKPAHRCGPLNLGFEEEEIDEEFEELQELEAEERKKDDDDIDVLRGDFHSFREMFTGRTNLGMSDKKVRKQLEKENLWDIPSSMRGEVYRYLRRNLKKNLLPSFREKIKSFNRSTRNLKVARWQSDSDLIRRVGIRLIGCTTTGLSKYRGLLASLQPRTLLIEEAAETLEGTILAAQFESLEQLILVGDHQQLQANCNIDALRKGRFNLSISMFERLVNNGVEFTMLNTQRRMITEIRELLNPFYPELRDHQSVLDRKINRPPIPGMGGRDSYWFHHDWPEGRDETGSRFNLPEAEMIASFFAHLFLNGIDPHRITVLTFYNGQRKVLIKELSKNPHLRPYEGSFKVFTVDSYQGEENDVILLSLVRSNNFGEIGFLENKNRAVVSLSRARQGMYVFGNAFNLLAKIRNDDVWFKVTGNFSASQPSRLNIHRGLPIVCSMHGSQLDMMHAADFDGLAGGCTVKCRGELPCGHACPHLCHPFSHDKIICKQPCERLMPGCNHGCSERCGYRCRCPCGVLPEVTRDESEYGVWSPTLDDVFGNSPTKKSRFRMRYQPNMLAQIYQESPSLRRSNPNAWAQWDPVNADYEIEEKARSSKSASPVKSSGPAFKETHLPVSIQNGARVKNHAAATTRILHSIENSPNESKHTRTKEISIRSSTPTDSVPDSSNEVGGGVGGSPTGQAVTAFGQNASAATLKTQYQFEALKVSENTGIIPPSITADAFLDDDLISFD